jgi:hypothetical protein
MRLSAFVSRKTEADIPPCPKDLGAEDFDNELAATMTALRNGLKRRGVHRFQDLDID